MKNYPEIFSIFLSLNKISQKWTNYFDVYTQYLSPYINKPCNLLEIGVENGGSLDLWNQYLGASCNIYAIDINPSVLNHQYSFPVDIFIGDQADPTFLEELKEKTPPFDIIIDDGGHQMDQQINSLLYLFPHLKSPGVYIVEDTHTSYWKNFGGGLYNPNSFIEKSKLLIDLLNRQHFPLEPTSLETIFKDLHSIQFLNSLVVFEKRDYQSSKVIFNLH